jgi:SAM-dependent methyltransferase
MSELLIGAGRDHARRIAINGRREWSRLVTLDNNPEHAPDVLHDLETLPYPFPDESFDEIHAYEVLEHTGAQGDARFFFEQFSELWRILRPGGFLAATCPSWRSMWAWGDPSHKRVLCSGSLVFLSQAEYVRQVGKTPMSDYRHLYRADFEAVPGAVVEDTERFWFVLEAIKPSRFSLTTELASSTLAGNQLASIA